MQSLGGRLKVQISRRTMHTSYEGKQQQLRISTEMHNDTEGRAHECIHTIISFLPNIMMFGSMSNEKKSQFSPVSFYSPCLQESPRMTGNQIFRHCSSNTRT
mmetsp:Transcript_3798/g.14430  ORF Transcript_3798/g.14430 Transcript_3798/m.14430 type:complete len:102 (-) Transcript_3798:566-871(-)